jgi:hypothetical protein
MFHFSQTKSLVMLILMSAMLVVATDPDLPIRLVRELDSDHRVGQVREWLRSNRQLQSSCEKTSPALDAAEDKLTNQTSTTIENCDSTTCNVNFASYSAYTTYKNGCIASKGAFTTYKISINCGIVVIVLSNIPFCLVSMKVNSSCGPKSIVDDLELFFDIDGCSETVTNTGYTDYYSPKPVKKPVKKRVKKPVKKPVKLVRRHALAMK